MTHQRSVLVQTQGGGRALLIPRVWRADLRVCLRRVRVGVGRWIED